MMAPMFLGRLDQLDEAMFSFLVAQASEQARDLLDLIGFVGPELAYKLDTFTFYDISVNHPMSPGKPRTLSMAYGRIKYRVVYELMRNEQDASRSDLTGGSGIFLPASTRQAAELDEYVNNKDRLALRRMLDLLMNPLGPASIIIRARRSQ